MASFHDFLSMLRNSRSSFAPRGPASCDVQRPAGAAGAQPQPDMKLLHAAGEKLLARSRAQGQSPALAVLQIDDLPEVDLLFGPAAVDAVVEAAMAGLKQAAGGVGLVVRTAVDTFALLMPGGGATTTIAAIQARLGKPCTIEVAVGRDDVLVVPDVMVFPLAAQDTVAQVHDELCRRIAKARQQGRRIPDCVPQAAAGGSTRLPAATAAAERTPHYCPPLPATIPMPLGTH